jgi:aromatic ring hydroxylase
MGIRTAEQYKKSLRDGRRVYIAGEKVEDITKHRVLGVTCDTIAAGYALAASENPEICELLTVTVAESLIDRPLSRLPVIWQSETFTLAESITEMPCKAFPEI